MNNLFTLAANEATAGSVFYLNSIFGTVGPVLGGSGPAILGTMFTVFNTIVLALGSLIVTYTTVMTILLTAHEGEALGKKFHGLWTPIRTVIGIAALVPTTGPGGGYSYLQIGLMWFIIQGVGAADTLWTKTVDYVAGGNTTTPAPPGAASAALQGQMGQVFVGLVCQAAAKANYANGYFCNDNPSDTFCKLSTSDMLSVTPGSPQVVNNVYSMGPGPGTCGTLTLGDPTTAVGQAQNAAWQQIISTAMGPLAAQFVALDNDYTSWVNMNGLVAPAPPSWVTQYCSDHGLSGTQCKASAFSSLPPPTMNPKQMSESANTVKNLYWPYGLSATAGGNFISLAANLYTGLVGAAMATPTANPLTQAKATAEANGWIFAGGFYYYIAKANSTINTNVGSIGISPAQIMNLPEVTEQALTTAAGTLIQAVGTSTPSSSNLGGMSTSCGGGFLPGVGDFCGDIINGWIGALNSSSGQNPVIAAQSFGDSIVSDVEWAVLAVIGANVILGLAGGIYLGTGPGTAAALTLANSLMPIVIFFVVTFLGLGLTLAVYTPMIPYMLFTFGAINWLIATIETMIAAPIVAIGLLHPEGGENIWGKAEEALMLMLNIFLRPSLMIFGMIAGMLMSFTVIMMINYAFLTVVTMVSPSSNLLETIMFMVLYTSLFTTSINQCFNLIHAVPDNILRWIGGGQKQFGEGGGLDKVSGAFESGAGKVSSGTEGVAKQGGDALKAYGKQKKANQAKEAEAASQKGLLDAIKGGGGGGGGGAAPAP